VTATIGTAAAQLKQVPEYVIHWMKLLCVATHCLNLAGDVASKNLVSRCQQAAIQPGQERLGW
jgi:hypothetical protein